MGTQADDSKKTAMRALRRRHALLAAYLDVLDRLDGPRPRRAPEFRQEKRPRRDIPTSRPPPTGAVSSAPFLPSPRPPPRRPPPLATSHPPLPHPAPAQ